jgi:hypothetical protein
MTQITASMPCDQALSAWLEQHLSYIRGATPRIYRQYIKVLAEFFKQKPVGEIRLADVRAFQEWRKQRCGASRVTPPVWTMICGLANALMEKRTLSGHEAIHAMKASIAAAIQASGPVPVRIVAGLDPAGSH